MPENNDYSPGLIQSADLKEGGGEPKANAIKDCDQAREVVNSLIAAGRNRQIVNARILSKYGAEKPYDQAKLESEAVGWRSNFSTRPLAQLIEKIHPRLSGAVASLKYFTNASLSNKWENSVAKSEAFRAEFTKLCRSKKGWRDLIEDISLENSMFGSTIVVWLDEFSVLPKHFKQDCVFLSDGTRQLPSAAQVFAVRENFLPHELFALVKDRDAATAAGWNLENVRLAINAASPAQMRDNMSGGSLDSFYQNAIRELSVGSSYQAGASVISVYSLLAQETSGAVSHYRLGGDGMKELFCKEERFSSMEQCTSFFAYDKGNSTMYGSKGVGRVCYELACVLDRLRNEIVDRSIIAGKQLISGDPRHLHKFKMSLIGSMCIIPAGWEVHPERIDGAVEPMLRLDAYLQQIADQLIGSVSPKAFEGERVTKAAVDLWAAREEENRDVRLGRFLEFFTDMAQQIQRRACSKDTDDKDAKEFQKLLLEKMTRKELDELANEPVAGTVRDLTPTERQLIVALAAEKAGNPLYNQRALQIEDLNARMNSEFAERVLLPVNDKTEEAEQRRMQQIELALLSSGQPVPVSPRDNHEIHFSVLVPILEKLGAALMAGETGTDVFEVAIAHTAEHLQIAQSQGVSKEVLKPVEALLKKAMPIIAQLKQMDAQAEQIQDEGAALDQPEQQPPVQ